MVVEDRRGCQAALYCPEVLTLEHIYRDLVLLCNMAGGFCNADRVIHPFFFDCCHLCIFS